MNMNLYLYICVCVCLYGQPNQYLHKGKHGINTPQQNELILVLVNHRKISLKMVKKKRRKYAYGVEEYIPGRRFRSR
jgi:hypothetical protein